MRTALRTAAVGLATAAVVTVTGTGAALGAPPVKDAGAPGMELTARWWTAALASPGFSFFDDTVTDDKCVTVDLPSGPVVLAAGATSADSGHRTCTIPAGATVVLPVINQLWAQTDPTPDDTIGEGRRVNREFAEPATATATIDGRPAPVQRRTSSRFTIDGAVFGLEGRLPAVSDGSWLVFEAKPGVHRVQTLGTATGFTSATSYTFRVTSR